MSKAKQKASANAKSSAQRLGKNPSSKSAKRPDRRLRGVAEALDHHDRRNLKAAFEYGQHLGFAPTTLIDFHPSHMDSYPEGELAVWFGDELRNRISTWLRRRKVGWYAIWIRENYAGERREHIHLMLYCPTRLRSKLEAAIRRWYPGNAEMVKIDVMTWRKLPSGRFVYPRLEYRLKQMTSKAQGPPRPGRPRREVRNRHDGTPVAAVNGLRCGVSRILDKKARQQWEAGRYSLYAGGQNAQLDLLEVGERISP